ncbi:MAG: hypothetical protein KIT31_36710 [Deltaproteobacteria bacterium]|nr:hypothetical protein [Deltaproteobacteria bacterium]
MTEVPAWLRGAWRRDALHEGGRVDTSVGVFYVQTPRMFGDVRVPDDRPRFPYAMGLDELSDDELRLLARQKGFAGHTTYAGGIVTWHRELDYQPPTGERDEGRVDLRGRAMREVALDDSYAEDWWRFSTGEGAFLVREQRSAAGRLEQLFLLAGDHFIYARNRAIDLPAAPSLDHLVRDATRDHALAYLDCEVSYGLARGARHPWEILRSTLPWREGTRLDVRALPPAVVVDTLDPADRGALVPEA